MAENDNPNQDPQDQSEGYEDKGRDDSTREARTDSTPPASEQQNQGTRRQDQGADLDEADDSDEDRDDDDRFDGGANRRNSIG